jgi:hypothetical protein
MKSDGIFWSIMMDRESSVGEEHERWLDIQARDFI